MNVAFFPIEFNSGDMHYSGRVTPSEHKHADGTPKSYHVILNEVLFGNMSWDHTVWTVDEQRPEALVEAVGKEIGRYMDEHAG